jgi:hypothetical protein
MSRKVSFFLGLLYVALFAILIILVYSIHSKYQKPSTKNYNFIPTLILALLALEFCSISSTVGIMALLFNNSKALA